MSNLHAVIRNTVSKTLRNFKIIRGDNKDKEYQAPEITVETLDSDIKWLGRDTVVGVLQTFVKRASQEIWMDNIDENGQLNEAKFLAELADLTATSMKLADLKDRYDELVAKNGALIDALTDEPSAAELKSIKDLSSAISVVKAQMEARSRKTTKEVNAEPAVAV
jgi:hypothetical protein